MNALISNAQKQLIHRLIRQKGIEDEVYRKMVSDYSNGRTTSSKFLFKNEAQALISSLIGEDKKDNAQAMKYIRRIYWLALQIGCINRDYESSDPDEIEMNKAKINIFLRKRGAIKKDVSKQNVDELKQTVQQLEKITRKEN